MNKNIIIPLFFMCFLYANVHNQLISNNDYITGEDGVVRIYVNVVGNVKNPGIYLVYDGIDIMSMLSVSGGFLPGSNLSKIAIFTKDGERKNVNLKSAMNNTGKDFHSLIKLKPNDTIYVKETTLSAIFRSSNLPSIFLSFLNIVITITRYN